MTKYVYAYKNKKSGHYSDPFLNVIEKDNATEAFVVAAKEASKEEQVKLVELDLYYLGKYDTKTAKLELVEPEFMFSISEVLYGGNEEQVEKV